MLKKTGLPHGTMFLHFATKEALVRAAIEAFGRRLLEKLHVAATREVELESVLKAHLESIGTDEDFYAIVFGNIFLLLENPLSKRKKQN